MAQHVISKITEITVSSEPPRSKNAKPVFNLTTGEVYASSTDAANAIGCSQGNISAACLGKIRHAAHNQLCYVSDIAAHLPELHDRMTELSGNAADKANEIGALKTEMSETICELEALNEHIAYIKRLRSDIESTRRLIAQKQEELLRMETVLQRVMDDL